jgi:hypothetical protein
VRISSAMHLFLPVLLTLCSRPTTNEVKPVYMLNCRLINTGHWIYHQHCKAESREVHSAVRGSRQDGKQTMRAK